MIAEKAKIVIATVWLLGCACLIAFCSGVSRGQALCDAVSKDDLAFAELLLHSGAPIDTCDKKGSPLVQLVRSAPMMDMLVEHGAALQGSKPRAYSLLWNAASSGDMRMVRYLLGKGADPAATGSAEYRTHPFYQAMRNGNYDVGFYLLEVAPASIPIQQLEAGIMACVDEDDERTVRLVVERAAPVLANTQLKQHLLQRAARVGSPRVASFCLDSGADPNAPDERGNTPLAGAATAYSTYPVANEEVVRILLARGASVDAVNEGNGQRLLHQLAGTSRGAQFLKLFVENGAKVDAQDRKGNTPLHDAAMNGAADMTSLLLSSGADPRIQNERGETPYGIAKQRHMKEIIDIFEKAGIHE